jgi:hypothetical protein
VHLWKDNGALANARCHRTLLARSTDKATNGWATINALQFLECDPWISILTIRSVVRRFSDTVGKDAGRVFSLQHQAPAKPEPAGGPRLGQPERRLEAAESSLCAAAAYVMVSCGFIDAITEGTASLFRMSQFFILDEPIFFAART